MSFLINVIRQNAYILILCLKPAKYSNLTFMYEEWRFDISRIHALVHQRGFDSVVKLANRALAANNVVLCLASVNSSTILIYATFNNGFLNHRLNVLDGLLNA